MDAGRAREGRWRTGRGRRREVRHERVAARSGHLRAEHGSVAPRRRRASRCHRRPWPTCPGAEWDLVTPAGRRCRVADGRLGAQPGRRRSWRWTPPTRWRRSDAALADLADADVIGSAYCIRRYEVDARFGGRDGLAAARAALADRGVRLLVDFVPNHVAPDHPWLDRPSRVLRPGRAPTTSPPTRRASSRVGDAVIARGRDPYFPPWPDVAQLNAFAPGLRQAAADTLIDIADVRPTACVATWRC